MGLLALIGKRMGYAYTQAGEARDMEQRGPGVRAAGGPTELQGI
jgi:hypothetical protein